MVAQGGHTPFPDLPGRLGFGEILLSDQNLALANATLYLDAFGDVMIGWMWLWQARVAKAGLAKAGDDPFYRGKLAAFRYFFRYELPGVHARFALVGALDGTCLAMDAAAFTGV